MNTYKPNRTPWKRFAGALAMVACTLGGWSAVNMQQVVFHNEVSDTTRINKILEDACAKHFSTPSECAGFIGRSFIGTPYVAHTLEGDEELLRVNLDELDCTTFVETVAALTITVQEGRSSWRDFVYNLERIRYRKGEMDGYGSRLHYICDWIVDNSFRGNIEDITQRYADARYCVKTIDFMSRNRDRYKQLADSANYARILSVENGYRSHRFPYIKTNSLSNKRLTDSFQEGYLLALTSTVNNLDVTHMGMVVVENGVPYLLHASMSQGKVVISDVPLSDFMRRNRQFTGLRLLKIKD